MSRETVQLIVTALSVIAGCSAILVVIAHYTFLKIAKHEAHGFWDFMASGGIFLLSVCMGVGILIVWHP